MNYKNTIATAENGLEEIHIIRVVSREHLSDSERKKIEKTFSAKHVDKVAFSYLTDSLVLGGILVIDGEKLYDGTIKGQLSRMRHRLTK